MPKLTQVVADRLSLPLIASPLFIISNPALVTAQCTSGVIGSFPSLNARPGEMFPEWLHEIEEDLAAHDKEHPNALSAPYAVNLIVHRSNDRLDRDLQACIDRKVPIIITSLGARAEVNQAVHSYGGVVLHDVIDNKFARKAVEKGADGLIAVAAGAGGHAGTLSPFALIQEIREWFSGPIALSGAIASGRAILASQAIGADFAYMGSAFIATREANADERYKRMIAECSAADIVYSNLFTGVHGNYLRPSIVNAGMDPDNLPVSDPTAMNFGSERNAKPWKDIWGSGQGIGAIKSVQPAAELIRKLKAEYGAALTDLQSRSFRSPEVAMVA